MDPSENENRFHDLFDRHHHAVMAYFMRRIPDEADALDATEDVFLVAWRKLEQVPEDDAALPWLYGVARRVLANHLRGRARFARLRRKLAAGDSALAIRLLLGVRGPPKERKASPRGA